MTADITMMVVVLLRAIVIVRGIRWQVFIVMMMPGILGRMHGRKNFARIVSNNGRVEAKKDPKHQYPFENDSHFEPDGYTTDRGRQAKIPTEKNSEVSLSTAD